MLVRSASIEITNGNHPRGNPRHVYRKLAETEGFTEAKVKALRELFDSGKKPKAADVIRALVEPAKAELP